MASESLARDEKSVTKDIEISVFSDNMSTEPVVYVQSVFYIAKNAFISSVLKFFEKAGNEYSQYFFGGGRFCPPSLLAYLALTCCIYIYIIILIFVSISI